MENEEWSPEDLSAGKKICHLLKSDSYQGSYPEINRVGKLQIWLNSQPREVCYVESSVLTGKTWDLNAWVGDMWTYDPKILTNLNKILTSLSKLFVPIHMTHSSHFRACTALYWNWMQKSCATFTMITHSIIKLRMCLVWKERWGTPQISKS